MSLRKQLVSQDESLDVLEIVSPLSERVATCRSEFFLSVISMFFQKNWIQDPRDISIPMFIAASFMKAKMWKQTKCPLMAE